MIIIIDNNIDHCIISACNDQKHACSQLLKPKIIICSPALSLNKIDFDC